MTNLIPIALLGSFIIGLIFSIRIGLLGRRLRIELARVDSRYETSALDFLRSPKGKFSLRIDESRALAHLFRYYFLNEHNDHPCIAKTRRKLKSAHRIAFLSFTLFTLTLIGLLRLTGALRIEEFNHLAKDPWFRFNLGLLIVVLVFEGFRLRARYREMNEGIDSRTWEGASFFKLLFLPRQNNNRFEAARDRAGGPFLITLFAIMSLVILLLSLLLKGVRS